MPPVFLGETSLSSKVTELGASQIWSFLPIGRSPKWDGKKLGKRLKNLEKIALWSSRAKQGNLGTNSALLRKKSDFLAPTGPI